MEFERCIPALIDTETIRNEFWIEKRHVAHGVGRCVPVHDHAAGHEEPPDISCTQGQIHEVRRYHHTCDKEDQRHPRHCKELRPSCLSVFRLVTSTATRSVILILVLR